jgi:hypothetical protein
MFASVRSAGREGPRRRLRKPTLYEAAAIAIASLAVGGVAYATIPSNGVISACYMKSGGNLRVIDGTTGSCSSKETSLNWNVAGVQGPAGPAGATGATGATGAAGPAGISGYELVTESSTYVSPFEPDRLDVRAHCPAGKKFLGGGYAFYLVPPGYAPQYTPAERVNALPESSDGNDAYYVTVIHPIPAGDGAKLTAVAACAYVNG